MKKFTLVLFFNFFVFSSAFSQGIIQWQKSLGGTDYDDAYSIQQTTDGGYIVAGLSRSNNGDVTGNHGNVDYWIVKLDSAGIIQWQKSLGGSSYEDAHSIQQTNDGGYIVAGRSQSNNGDVTGNHGNADYWIVKLDSAGIIQWQKCFGGTGADYAYSIQQTADSGYIVAGQSTSNNGNVTGNHGYWDYWVVKLDSAGIIQWQKCLGGTLTDVAFSIQQTTDRGYIVAGYTNSNDGDVTGHHGSNDYWIVKLDSVGSIQWQKCLGGTGNDNAFSIRQTTDGGYIVAGESWSIDGDITSNHGNYDYWIVKLDSSGIIQWQKSLGGTTVDEAYSTQQTMDGGYIVAGMSISNDGDVTGNHGQYDYWTVKLDGAGIIQWQKCLGGTGNEYAYSIQQTTDGGYIVAGESYSNNGDVTGNHGLWDFWIVKLYPDSVTGIKEQSFNNTALKVYPNPAKDELTLSGYQLTNGKAEIKVYDITGREVFSTQPSTPNTELNTQNFTKGIYFVQAGALRGKFVKE